MLGTNGIEWTDKEKLASMYESLIVKLKEAAPDAIIYIQSVLPVTKELNDNVNRDLTNEKINAFNDLLLELAQKEQVYYLNVAEDFRDSQGNLPEDASPVDGIHFTVAYYQKWIEYLRYHTVEGMSVRRLQSPASRKRAALLPPPRWRVPLPRRFKRARRSCNKEILRASRRSLSVKAVKKKRGFPGFFRREIPSILK